MPESQANFVWLADGTADGEINAAAFAAGCEERGVIVRALRRRRRASHIGSAEENDAFLSAAAELRTS